MILPLFASAQKRRPATAPIRPITQARAENSAYTKYRTPLPAVVVVEKLAVLRFEPNLAAVSMQRMSTGRSLLILGEQRQTADGITFLRVSVPPETRGWVQSEAVASAARPGDETRVARLIRVAKEFEQLELTTIFLENFPKSAFRPAILLLAGDLAQEAASKISRDVLRKIDPDEIEASGAPAHTFYQNFNGLDRYRKLDFNFVFNQNAKQFYYDGKVWREILQKYPASAEAAEARKRLESLNAQTK